jgi:hypothetical protein
MKLKELDMKCGECEIIDHCNNHQDTPPCAQPRLENLTVEQFLDVVDYILTRSEPDD